MTPRVRSSALTSYNLLNSSLVSGFATYWLKSAYCMPPLLSAILPISASIILRSATVLLLESLGSKTCRSRLPPLSILKAFNEMGVRGKRTAECSPRKYSYFAYEDQHAGRFQRSEFRTVLQRSDILVHTLDHLVRSRSSDSLWIRRSNPVA